MLGAKTGYLAYKAKTEPGRGKRAADSVAGKGGDYATSRLPPLRPHTTEALAPSGAAFTVPPGSRTAVPASLDGAGRGCVSQRYALSCAI